MITYIVYIVYNLVYQLLSFFFFLYANTYLNDALVPQNLMWKDNKPRTDAAGLGGAATIKTLALIIEAALLLLLIYILNQLFLKHIARKDKAKSVASRTAMINGILSFCFIAILIWGSFRGYLW
jgi:hypothetical protein